MFCFILRYPECIWDENIPVTELERIKPGVDKVRSEYFNELLEDDRKTNSMEQSSSWEGDIREKK
jgi:hypothetical protein